MYFDVLIIYELCPFYSVHNSTVFSVGVHGVNFFEDVKFLLLALFFL